MSSIIFVRHAQASLFASDYDQLSDLGQQQAGWLGKYLAGLGVGENPGFDEIYIGPRRRHRQTAEAILQQAPQLACPLMELQQLDEHHVERLVTEFVARIGAAFPEVRQLHQVFLAAQAGLPRQQAFARLFEAVAGLWVTNRCELYGVESWSEFTLRVNAGIDAITQREGRGRRVLVITSAGTIVATLLRALQCPDEVALGLGWRIWNCSLTRFAFSDGRFTLDQFNAMPNFHDRQMWTYR
jgi:broad specificity phosphatase PhoE